MDIMLLLEIYYLFLNIVIFKFQLKCFTNTLVMFLQYFSNLFFYSIAFLNLLIDLIVEIRSIILELLYVGL